LLHEWVGMLRAMNHGAERVFNPDRKDPHWDVEAGAGLLTVFSMLAGCVSSPRYKKAVADFLDRWRLSLLGAYSCQKLLSRIKTAVLGE
jgi:hypothetical protein